MPANLTPQYHKAEQAYRSASTPEEELDALQDMLKELPKHKGTDKLQADLKHKISRLKKELQSAPKSRRSAGLRIPRQGAGRVILLGSPNSGKSQFVASTTNAEPEVADYPFSTRELQPAMMPFEDVMIQLIDAPPVTADFLNPDLVGLVRGADMVLLFLDLGSDDGLSACQEVIERFQSTKTRLGKTTYVDEEDLGVTYTRTLLLLNKIDLADAPLRLQLFREAGLPDFDSFQISAVRPESLDQLRSAVFAALDVIRVYTKLPTHKQADFERPYTVRRGGTVADIAAQIHRDMADQLKFARVWGSGVHDGTTVKPDHVLEDKDIVELHV